MSSLDMVAYINASRESEIKNVRHDNFIVTLKRRLPTVPFQAGGINRTIGKCIRDMGYTPCFLHAAASIVHVAYFLERISPVLKFTSQTPFRSNTMSVLSKKAVRSPDG